MRSGYPDDSQPTPSDVSAPYKLYKPFGPYEPYEPFDALMAADDDDDDDDNDNDDDGEETETTALLIRPSAPSMRLNRRAGGWVSGWGTRRAPTRFASGMIRAVAFITAAVLLLGGAIVTTPLGQSLGSLTNYDAAANAFALKPTPTHTPKPSTGGFPAYGANPGASVVKAEITAVFGSSYASGAIRVATCESGLNPNVMNSTAIGSSHAAGVFQILYPSTWNTTSYRGSSPFDYRANIRAAHEIFQRDGNSWREWSCQP